MHFGDYTFIFVLALILFGPKKLPEMARQLGKLLAEFRRASNEFKFQIQEELRTMEEEERKKKLAESQALAAASDQAMIEAGGSSRVEAEPTILPPSTGAPVSTARPFAYPKEACGAPAPDSVEPETDEPIAPESQAAIAAARAIPDQPATAASNGKAESASDASASLPEDPTLPFPEATESLTHG
jgi:TatA/E family protein of Tat protein translocase